MPSTLPPHPDPSVFTQTEHAQLEVSEARKELEEFTAQREELETEASAAAQLRERVAELAAELEEQRTEVSPRTQSTCSPVLALSLRPSTSPSSPSPSRSPIDFTPSLPARALSSALSFSH